MKLSDTLKTSCKSFSMKLLEVKKSWNSTVFRQGRKIKFYEMKQFSCEQKKKIQYNLWHKN